MHIVEISNQYPGIIILRPPLERLIRKLATLEKKILKKIYIIVADDNLLNQLKKQYFNEDTLTDTISFNLNESGKPIEGEIYLSLDRIAENAEKYNNSFNEELRTVIVHSILHLFGYEDSGIHERKQMFALQNFYLKSIPQEKLYRRKRKDGSGEGKTAE